MLTVIVSLRISAMPVYLLFDDITDRVDQAYDAVPARAE
jgi:hypothetical protein